MKRRLLAVLLSALLALSACGRSNELQLERNQLLGVGNFICSWGEAQIFILTQQSAYGAIYGNDVWDVSLSEGSFEEYIRDSLLEYLKTLLLAAYAADQRGVSLSEAEQREVELATEALLADLGSPSSRLGITREAVRAAYTHYALAQIFYRQAVTDAQLEISDEEARVISLQIVESEGTYGYEQASEMAEKLKDAVSVTEAISGYEGVSARQVSVTRGAYSNNFETIVFALKQDQWSPVITEDGNYFIVRCLSPYLADATEQHKAQMALDAREEALTKTLKSYARTAQMIYNPDLWDSWRMDQYTEAPSIDFFAYTAVFEK